MNREQSRRVSANAPALARLAAACSFDSGPHGLMAVTRPKAMVALTRAFERMVKAGSQPMAFPVGENVTSAVPASRPMPLPGALHALAVGLDIDGRAVYALQSAVGPHRAVAYDVARSSALARLEASCRVPGLIDVPTVSPRRYGDALNRRCQRGKRSPRSLPKSTLRR